MRPPPIHRFARLPLLALVFALPGAAAAPPPVSLPHPERIDLFDGLLPGWREHWREQRLFPLQKRTRYSVETTEHGHRVLRAESHDAALALVRPLPQPAPRRAILRWRWRVDDGLARNRHERERRGDDFAARIFVVFEKAWLPTHTRAVNYVWSAHEPAGSIFPGAYSRRVGMFVLRCSAAGDTGWQHEERDLLADYRCYFGRDPEQLTAVAVMVDTDNTGMDATAWFADLFLEIIPAETDKTDAALEPAGSPAP